MERMRFLIANKITLILLTTTMIVIGLTRIVLTYDVFWQTWDEPAHVAAGMEWLDKWQYEYENFHPPLARIMAALGLFLKGVRGNNESSIWVEGQKILLANHEYEKNLTLARVGILPFFVLASMVVALWAHLYGGALTCLISVMLFTTLPAILGHAGLATMDMAFAATLALALWALDMWLCSPTPIRSAVLGSAAGLAVLSKFPALIFLPACAGTMILIYAFGLTKEVPSNLGSVNIVRWIKPAVVASVAGLAVIWGGYRFSIHWIEAANRPHTMLDRIFGISGQLHNLAYYILEHSPIPAPEFVNGLLKFADRNELGHPDYFLGQVRTNGWWYYFPVLLVFKTPLPFLFLSVCGLLCLVKQTRTNSPKLRLLSPAVFLFTILGLSSQTHVNNGTRHVLVVYPLMAVLAGYGASYSCSLRGRLRLFGRTMVIVLVSWQLASSLSAHPDYIAYFNELAGNHPEEIVVDSDLDWGQDLKRLAKALKSRGIKELWIKYNGSVFLTNPEFGLPSIRELQPYQHVSGWIAISVLHLKTGLKKAPYDQFLWLDQFKPVDKIGKSIWLYNIDGTRGTTPGMPERNRDPTP